MDGLVRCQQFFLKQKLSSVVPFFRFIICTRTQSDIRNQPRRIHRPLFPLEKALHHPRPILSFRVALCYVWVALASIRLVAPLPSLMMTLLDLMHTVQHTTLICVLCGTICGRGAVTALPPPHPSRP